MEDNWVMIFSSTDEKLCKKAKTILKKENVKVELIKKNENNIFIGIFEIYVEMNDIAKARVILKGLRIE
jgi:hypothetical protein